MGCQAQDLAALLGDNSFQQVGHVATSFLADIAKRAIAYNRRRSTDETLSAEIRQDAARNAAGIIQTCLQRGILEVADVR